MFPNVADGRERGAGAGAGLLPHLDDRHHEHLGQGRHRLGLGHPLRQPPSGQPRVAPHQ